MGFRNIYIYQINTTKNSINIYCETMKTVTQNNLFILLYIIITGPIIVPVYLHQFHHLAQEPR